MQNLNCIHVLYFRVLCDYHNEQFLYTTLSDFFFVMEAICIICKVRTDRLYLMQIRSSLQTYFLPVLSL